MSQSLSDALVEAINQSKKVALVRMSTAPLSLVASITILVLIARSEKKLTSTQNRLLVGISIADAISSAATAFATIPMPEETIYVWWALGNTSTCEAQGFFYILGGLITPCYNASLCIFFFLKIWCEMDDDRIRQKIEPFLHGVPIIYGLTFAIYCLAKKFINASVGVCWIADYPLTCSTNPKIPCIRGENYTDDPFAYIVTAMQFFVIPVIIFGTMIAVYVKVIQQERRMATFGVGSLSPAASTSIVIRDRTTPTRRNDNRYVRMTMYRGLAYSGSWFTVFIFPFIQVMQNMTSNDLASYELRLLVAIFYPLQGVLNFGVYIYPKIMEVRRLDPDQSAFQAFLFVMKTSGSIRAEITRRRRFARNRNNNNNRQQSSMIVRSVNDVPENIVERNAMVTEGEGLTTSSPNRTTQVKFKDTTNTSLPKYEEEKV